MTTLNTGSLGTGQLAGAGQGWHDSARRGALKAPRSFTRRAAAQHSRAAALTPAGLAERARIRAVLAIAAGVLVVAIVLAAFLLPIDLLGLGSLGITLTILLFGSPFWICAIDEAAEQAQQEAQASAVGQQ